MGMVGIHTHHDPHWFTKRRGAFRLGGQHFFNIRMELMPVLLIHDIAFLVLWTVGINHDLGLVVLLQVTKDPMHPIQVTLVGSHYEMAQSIDCTCNVKMSQGD